MGMLVRAAPWVNQEFTEEFTTLDDQNKWFYATTDGVLPWIYIDQLVAGDVNAVNTFLLKNFSYVLLNNYRLRTDKFSFGFTVGDQNGTKSTLETRLIVMRNSLAPNTSPPKNRATYLDICTSAGYFRSTNTAGTQTSTTLASVSGAVNIAWEVRVNGASWAIYRNGVLNSTRTDPNGAVPFRDGDFCVGIGLSSDRASNGTKNWSPRVQRWWFKETGAPS